jgi:hypothetical protein
MADIDLSKLSVSELCAEIRRRGAAVAVFVDADVAGAHCGPDVRLTKRLLAEGADWLSVHRTHVEDAMVEGGWNPINLADDPISPRKRRA